ncbi:MAG: UbiD family decarboxylase [Dehalococcoidia bacterium]|nr:UbiD family decarboxylase [Dehalococcoidia bacterium]
MHRDLRGFLRLLEKNGEVVRVSEPLSPRFEVGAAIKYVDRELGKAVLCEAIEGYAMPLVGNLLGSRKRVALALGTEKDPTEEYLSRRERLAKPVVADRGPANEIVIRDQIDILSIMPVLTHHEGDAGPYLTSAVTVARVPETGERGLGIHRVQVKGKDRIGLLLASPPLSLFFQKAERLNRPLEIATCVGVDPLTFLASVLPAPGGLDKFEVAGALAGEPIQLVKCQSVDLEVPATAEFVLEGRVTPGSRETEGPFGESTGYYLTFENPVAQVIAATHRSSPIYHALMPFTSEDQVLLEISWEAEMLRALQRVFPAAQRLHLRQVGLTTVVQIKKTAEGDGMECIRQVLAVHPHTKTVIVVDEDVNPYSLEEVTWALATRFQPDRDILVVPEGTGIGIDPSSRTGNANAKMGLDLTKPYAERDRFSRVDVPQEAREKAEALVQALLRVKDPGSPQAQRRRKPMAR